MKLPRELDAGKDYGEGNEWWADKFLYPNGWEKMYFRKVALLEESEDVKRRTSGPHSLLTMILFLMFILLCNTLFELGILER
ncbi:hypothetical protein QOT17_007001 [Balamuthia mandrillaris]